MISVTCAQCGHCDLGWPDETGIKNCSACGNVIMRAEGAPFTPALVWWSREGAEAGTPWRVRASDGTIEDFKAVRITGTVVLEAPTEELPGGPRGVLRVVDGTLEAGR